MKNFTTAPKVLSILVLLASMVFARTQEQTVQVKPDGDWKGTIEAGGAKLDLILHVSTKDSALTATIDSPDQGATGLAIDSITVTGKSLRFEMKSLGATYEGTFSADGSQIEGEFSQGGQKLTLTFKRVAKNDSSESVLKLYKVDVGGHGLNLLVGFAYTCEHDLFRPETGFNSPFYLPSAHAVDPKPRFAYQIQNFEIKICFNSVVNMIPFRDSMPLHLVERLL